MYSDGSRYLQYKDYNELQSRASEHRETLRDARKAKESHKQAEINSSSRLLDKCRNCYRCCSNRKLGKSHGHPSYYETWNDFNTTDRHWSWSLPKEEVMSVTDWKLSKASHSGTHKKHHKKRLIMTDVESGSFTPPKRTITGVDTTLATIRKKSFRVLEARNFTEYTTMKEDGSLIFLNHKKKKKSVSQKTQESEDSFGAINYALQQKLDEGIAIPKRPVDGYGEALIESRRSSASLIIDLLFPSAFNIRKSSSKNSVPTKMTNLSEMKNSQVTNSDSSDRRLSSMSTNSLLEILPSLSQELGKELMDTEESNLSKSMALEQIFEQNEKLQSNMYSSERWYALVYLDYSAENGVEVFRRLLIRLLLQSHHIAFQERDIDNEDVYLELLERPRRGIPIQIPFVFTNGIAIGGCKMMYTLYKHGAMHRIFKQSIMDPKMYQEWLHSPVQVKREPPALQVPVDAFPLINGIMKGELVCQSDSLEAENIETFLMTGAFIITNALRRWDDQIERQYSEPRLLLFVQLNRMIWNILCLIEEMLDVTQCLKLSVPHTKHRKKAKSPNCKPM